MSGLHVETGASRRETITSIGSQDRDRPPPARAQVIERSIEDNISLPLTVARVAALSGLGLRDLGRACRETFGLGPRALIVHMRLAHAKRLMATTDDPLSQIALACGFADQPHFQNRFRHVTGLTPNAWRRTHRAN
ncbi:AraC family transcriptional regulator [Caulobacter sp.]|uniref:helix-turn-helix domain-containing protein n=1 Tax=Caulobacter sp. TaxID=78 RepID=UPI0016122F61